MSKKVLIGIGVIGLIGLVATLVVLILVEKNKPSDEPRWVEVEVEAVDRPSAQPPQVPYQSTVPLYANRLVCPACQGAGYFSMPSICPVCYGAGKVITVTCVGYVGGVPVYQRSPSPVVCAACGGYGYHLPTSGRCETCGGKTLPEYFNMWQDWARQWWLTRTGGRYAEVNATP